GIRYRSILRPFACRFDEGLLSAAVGIRESTTGMTRVIRVLGLPMQKLPLLQILSQLAGVAIFRISTNILRNGYVECCRTLPFGTDKRKTCVALLRRFPSLKANGSPMSMKWVSPVLSLLKTCRAATFSDSNRVIMRLANLR